MCNKKFAFVSFEGFGSKTERDIFLLHDNEIYVFLDFTFIKSVIIKVTAIIVPTHLHETEVKTVLTVIMKVSKIFLKIA